VHCRILKNQIMGRSGVTILKITEIIAIYIGLPLLYWFDYIPLHKAIPLFLVFLVYLLILVNDKNFNRKIFWLNSFKNWTPIFIRVMVFFVLSVIAVIIFMPENLFIVPRTNPLLFMLIFIFYPVWSAYPQELIYRAYFYYRFSSIFKNERLSIIINALLFSFSHIIFNNWIAIVLTFFGSLLFSYVYKKSNSLMVTFIEHALYGNIIFIVGLGKFFYLPING
jgi:membrane protease YdiL (CAAX protease family)